MIVPGTHRFRFCSVVCLAESPVRSDSDGVPPRLKETWAERRPGGSELAVWGPAWWWGNWRTFVCKSNTDVKKPSDIKPLTSESAMAAACSDLSRLSGITPGDSEAGTVSVSVTGVVAVVVSSREELMKEVVLEAEGLVVMGV